MDTALAFALGEANRGNPVRVFDWDKAAKIIKERNPDYASAGLSEDWAWTGGVIYENGKPYKNDYTYLSSTWATPVLNIHTEDGIEEIECWVWENETKWNAETKWPKSALDILTEGENER